MPSISVNPTIDTEVMKIRSLIEQLEKLGGAVDRITFLTISDVMKLTGWSRPTVEKTFNRPDFPSCDFGKEKIVELTALRDYFSVPRRKERDYVT